MNGRDRSKNLIAAWHPGHGPGLTERPFQGRKPREFIRPKNQPVSVDNFSTHTQLCVVQYPVFHRIYDNYCFTPPFFPV